MNILFEVADLHKASPGTVGRCGIIYMECSSLGWRPLKQSFLENLPTTVFAADVVIHIFFYKDVIKVIKISTKLVP